MGAEENRGTLPSSRGAVEEEPEGAEAEAKAEVVHGGDERRRGDKHLFLPGDDDDDDNAGAPPRRNVNVSE